MENSYDWIWQPELLLAAWMSASFMLLTLSLLFYHLTRVSSIEMPVVIAGVFASLLIIVTLFLLCSALVPYWSRTRIAFDKHADPRNILHNNEKTIRWVYISISILLIMIFMGITFFILKGTYNTFRNRMKKNLYHSLTVAETRRAHQRGHVITQRRHIIVKRRHIIVKRRHIISTIPCPRCFDNNLGNPYLARA